MLRVIQPKVLLIIKGRAGAFGGEIFYYYIMIMGWARPEKAPGTALLRLRKLDGFILSTTRVVWSNGPCIVGIRIGFWIVCGYEKFHSEAPRSAISWQIVFYGPHYYAPMQSRIYVSYLPCGHSTGRNIPQTMENNFIFPSNPSIAKSQRRLSKTTCQKTELWNTKTSLRSNW